MDRILWIGPRFSARELKTLLADQPVEVSEFDSVAGALQSTVGLPVAAAVVLADWADATASIEALRNSRPEVEVLAATRRGVPVHLGTVLRSGASDVLDMETRQASDLAAQVRRAIAKHHQTVGERELLLRLRSLNEEFLKNMVALEKRNIELEKSLSPDASRLEIAGKPRVLIIDDEPALLQVFEMILEGSGYDVVSAMDAEAGLNVFRDQPFHLVITDKNLPGKNGLEVMREVKAMHPDSEVIMITGYGSKEAAVEALNLGASAFLEKPFDDINEVRAKVEQAVERQRERATKRQFLQVIKERNRAFLDRYRAIRQDIDAVLQKRDHPEST